MRFSIIILTRDGLQYLRPCIGSLLPQLRPAWEIIVLDNGSTDETDAFMKEQACAALRYVPMPENKGFAEGNNIAVQHAHGEWIFLLNNDTVCDSRLIAALEEAVDAYLAFRIFACRMVRMADGRIDNCGIHFSRLLRGYQLRTGELNVDEAPAEVFGASGGAMLVHRSVIDEIGLFDPQFFAYQEDVDFAVRARVAGFRCLYLPTAMVHHKGGGTSSTAPPFYRYYLQRNMELVLRNVPRQIVWKYALPHLSYSLYQVLKWTAKGDARTVLKAKVDALRILRSKPARTARHQVGVRQFQRFLAGCFPGPNGAAASAACK